MSLLFDLAKAYMIGLVGVAFLPAMVRPLSWQRKQSVIQTFTNMAVSTLGRGLMLKREHGGLKLVKTRFDTRIGSGAEVAKIGGEKKHWKDPENLMSTFHGKPFGLAHESRNVIVDARRCYLARLYTDLKDNHDWELQIDGETYKRAFFGVDAERALVAIEDAVPVIQGSADPGLADRVEEYGRIGNSLYNSTQMLQGVKFLMTFGGIFLLMWLGRKLMETTAGGSTVIPGVIL